MSANTEMIVDDEQFDYTLFDAPARRLAPAVGRADTVLLDMLGAEIADLAGSVAAATSIANAALHFKAHQVEIRTIARYLPPTPSLYPIIVGQLVASDASPELIRALQHFHAHLRAVCETTRAAIEARVITGAQLQFLSDAWRETCGATIEVADAISARLKDSQGEPRMLLRRSFPQLSRAAAGEAPCVKPGGVIEVPGLVERRNAPRYPVCWHAEAIVDGREIAIVVENLSRHGLGATCSRPLARGLEIEIQLAGRTLPGRIMWSRGDQFGVFLRTAFGDNDDLLLAAQTDARQ